MKICPKMRKILITEAQLKKILAMEEIGYPLDTKSDDEKPDNFALTDVAVDNTDPDAPNDVTDLDNFSMHRTPETWFGMGRYTGAMYRLPESEELDNAKNSGFGVNNDAYISATANAGKGKMAANINAEVQSDKKGSRNNTNQVRANRMRQYKQTNPALYQKNGGDKMLDILDNQTRKQSSANKSKHNADIRTQDTTPNAFKNGKNGAYYFK